MQSNGLSIHSLRFNPKPPNLYPAGSFDCHQFDIAQLHRMRAKTFTTQFVSDRLLELMIAEIVVPPLG
ncbi:MAG: hypothetical protein RH917_14020 [Lacipirellulaceae bacterium]